MKEHDSIADLFREGLEHFEAPVKSGMWQQVAARIDAVPSTANPTSQTAASKAGAALKAGSGFSGWIAGTALVITGVAGVLTWNYLNPSTTQPRVSAPAQEVHQAESPALNDVASPGNAAQSGTIISSSNKTTQVAPLNSKGTANQAASSDLPANHATGTPDANADAHNLNDASGSAPAAAPVNNHSTEAAHGSVSEPNTQTSPASQVADQPDHLRISADVPEGTAPFETGLKATGGAGVAEWTFEDNGAVTRGFMIHHRFEKPGTYTVSCKLTAPDGTVQNESLQVTVWPPLSLSEIPNIFSPNGDNVNDVFVVRSTETIDIELTVYDKSGKVLHRSKGSEVSWDGTLNGTTDAPVGTYIYVIFATGQSGVKNTRTGTVTLIR